MRLVIGAAWIMFASLAAWGEVVSPPKSVAAEAVAAEAEAAEPTSGVDYRQHRLELSNGEGNWLVHIQWRLQFRYSYPFENNPQTPDAFSEPASSSFAINRGRLKVGGHAYRPWLSYYLEYDFPSNNLLD